MKRGPRFIVWLGVLWLLLCAGCAQAPVPRATGTTVRFFLETEHDAAALVVLPVSGVQIAVEPKPVFSEFDLVDVQVAREELGDCLRFQFSGAAARDLYRLTTTRQGRRLVLLIGGQPLGARRIDRPWQEGQMQIFVERPDSALRALAAELRETAAQVQRKATQR